MLFDLHTHTTLSPCSQLALPQILSQAKKKGLDGVCITDHDTMAVRHAIAEGIYENGLCVIFGMEYATPDGDFLLFGPFEELPAGLQAKPLLQHVANVGGVAIAAHPFRAQRQTKEEIIKRKLCTIVEGVNGRNSIHENRRVLEWQQYQVQHVGGSDAHTLDELGKVTTSFTIPVRSRTDLIHALQQGCFDQVYISTTVAA